MKSLHLFAALVLMGLLWGATIPLTKIAVSTGHQPLGLIVWQFLVSIIVLGGFVLINRIPIILNRQTLLFFHYHCPDRHHYPQQCLLPCCRTIAGRRDGYSDCQCAYVCVASLPCYFVWSDFQSYAWPVYCSASPPLSC